MPESTSDRPSDTEAAHQPPARPMAGDGREHLDQNFASHVEGAERRDPGRGPTHQADSDTTAGGAVADALPDDAVAESGEDVAINASDASR
ncbi:hypothetical protein GGQ87_002942 [Brevundimonas alba]|uniref:Uncharacterized protein n=1 Tax=Brevundimonas alba TaxID=74314 RepID=A0A7X5YN02_9CAUL|nr:hypothetical protein [Brevundimonas alba]NJC42647.1 hypothetical protein [Brevundimonas alba]